MKTRSVVLFALLLMSSGQAQQRWTRTYGGTEEDEGRCARPTLDGGYVVAGKTASFGAGYDDCYLIKTNANGSVSLEEPGSSRPAAAGSMKAVPNPFISFARIPGHEAERFDVYDISGELVRTCRGDRVGEGLAPAVYFIKPGGEHCAPVRIVKVR